ncbi:MAG: type II toxin-antitoxin system VapC family toxin [Bernardetiaceae bacterium]|nr:type II toxin-antitoxin system VapC family toxin [Bernardetiaceae bacterium]
MTYLLDTNILLHLIRNSVLWQQTKRHYQLSDSDYFFISVVTVGEVLALARKNHWGEKRLRALDQLLGRFTVLDINNDAVLFRYADIDAYSQGLLPGLALPPGVSARNMGKNDLWIAATASVAGAVLLSADRDFEHLNGVFITLAQVSQPPI